MHTGLVQLQHTAHHTTKPMSYAQLSHNAREIVAKFTLATSQEVELGSDWYQSADRIASRIAGKYGLSPYTVTGIIAALSPNNEWSRNIIDAEALCKVFRAHGTSKDLLRTKVCTFDPNKKMAVTMLALPAMMPHQILTGPKRMEFYNCIIRPELDDVCIDGHAYSVWLGLRVPTHKTPHIGKKLRAQIKQDYRDACCFINEELGCDYCAAQIQAITWVTHKRIYS